MSRVQEVAPEVDAGPLLSGAQFADAFRIDVAGRALDARQAAQRMMGRAPRWVQALLTLRNLLVAPFGLKTSGSTEHPPRETIGLFPILTQTPDRLVAGFNDKHLDFRVVVSRVHEDGVDKVVLSTVVSPHNFLGKAYLFLISPFHKFGVRSIMSNAVAAGRV